MKQTNTLFCLPYLPLLIRLRCCEAVSLPNFLGSTLHGVLGWTLKSHPQVYQYLFENRRQDGGMDVVNPYLIDPPRAHSRYEIGEELCFQIALLGDATEFAEELILALTEKHIFTLGSGRKWFELVDILHGKHLLPIWQEETLYLKNMKLLTLIDDTQKGYEMCSLHLLTPLRIRRNGQLLTKIDFPVLIRNITKRITALCERYGGTVCLEEAERVRQISDQIHQTSCGLYLSKIERYSTRREKKMDFSGMLGAMTFEGELAPFTPWLNAACTLHIGRNVTLGCGKVDIVFG